MWTQRSQVRSLRGGTSFRVFFLLFCFFKIARLAHRPPSSAEPCASSSQLTHFCPHFLHSPPASQAILGFHLPPHPPPILRHPPLPVVLRHTPLLAVHHQGRRIPPPPLPFLGLKPTSDPCATIYRPHLRRLLLQAAEVRQPKSPTPAAITRGPGNTPLHQAHL